MHNRKLSLKWRITLLTVLVLTICSFALALSINIYVNRSLFGMTDELVYEAVPAPDGSESIGEIASGGSAIHAAVGVTNEQKIYGTIGNTLDSIYWGSVIALLGIVAIGGVLAYLISSQALKPIRELSESIMNVGESNLSMHLNLQGPDDEVKELKTSFNQMMAKIDSIVTSQKRFNADIAHELKTPLAVMQTNIDVLNEQTAKSPEEYEHVLQLVARSVSKMNAIIETLLDLVRQEKAPLNDRIAIDDLVCDVIEDLSSIAEAKGIAINAETRSAAMVKGNEILLYRSLYNIVENAIKYNAERGTVKVSCVLEKGQAIIRVSDTGSGIPKEFQHQIFEPFFRLDISKDLNRDSMGLGLSFAKNAIERHGGTVSIDSIPGQGTAVIITLPAYIPNIGAEAKA